MTVDRPALTDSDFGREHSIGALPVVDAGRLIGIVTETDLLRAYVRSADAAAALWS